MPENIIAQMNAAHAAMSGQAQTPAQPVQAAPMQAQPQYVPPQPAQYAQPVQYAMPPTQQWGQAQQPIPSPTGWSVPVVLSINGEEVTIYVNFPAETLANANNIIMAMVSQGHNVKHYTPKPANAWARNSSYGSSYRKGGWQ